VQEDLRLPCSLKPSSRMSIALGASAENTSSVKFRIYHTADMSGASKIALKV